MSGAVAILMGHSLSLYGGLKVAGTIDYSVATHPVWPSDLSLLPTWLLLAVGFCSFCCSIVVWGLSLRERFMKPVKRLAGVRIGMGIFFVGAWIGALVVYKLFETGDDGDSLGKYSCDHKSDDVVGGFEIARVCTEQSVGFGLAITSAILEIALIAAFAMRTVMNKKDGADGALSEKQAGKSRA
ncbi:ph domain-like protein [Neofusicoccum parvum]|nr:ph domain-like protein [Neofusicoccum parvum]